MHDSIVIKDRTLQLPCLFFFGLRLLLCAHQRTAIPYSRVIRHISHISTYFLILLHPQTFFVKRVSLISTCTLACPSKSPADIVIYRRLDRIAIAESVSSLRNLQPDVSWKIISPLQVLIMPAVSISRHQSLHKG